MFTLLIVFVRFRFIGGGVGGNYRKFQCDKLGSSQNRENPDSGANLVTGSVGSSNCAPQPRPHCMISIRSGFLASFTFVACGVVAHPCIVPCARQIESLRHAAPPLRFAIVAFPLNASISCGNAFHFSVIVAAIAVVAAATVVVVVIVNILIVVVIVVVVVWGRRLGPSSWVVVLSRRLEPPLVAVLSCRP
ncbi:hypothetical protein K456DRAFT_37522 [Colletotrichum gloeosporioides 23]|nr:hypothetical protein K456DRAFT_37522 [Colletotrichum gloeosporioides 23]